MSNEPEGSGMTEATFVFRHVDEAEARRFCKDLLAQYPFAGEQPTNIIAMAVGDAMSVADAVRAAITCRSLDADYERTEFALAMCDCNNWDDCMKLAAKWELAYEQGEFVDLRAAQGIEAATAAETVELGSVHESPVAASDAPKGEPRG